MAMAKLLNDGIPDIDDNIRSTRNILYRGLCFGVELEIEAPGLYPMAGFDEDYDPDDEDSLPPINPPVLPHGWQVVEEHSIDGPEVITAGAYAFDDMVTNIRAIFEDVRAKGFEPRRTCRGSTHIHMNCQDLTWRQLRNVLLCCAWAEPFLIEMAGKGRRGNLFAMSYRDAPLGWTEIINSIRARFLRLYNDTHYMAISFYSLTHLGTIEFRMPPSSRNADEAITWLEWIRDIGEAGRSTGDVAVDTMPPQLLGLYFAVPPARRDRLLRQAQEQVLEIADLLDLPYMDKRKPTKKQSEGFISDYELMSLAQTSPSLALTIPPGWMGLDSISTPVQLDSMPSPSLYTFPTTEGE